MKVSKFTILTLLVFSILLPQASARRIKGSYNITVEKVVEMLRRGEPVKWRDISLSVQGELLGLAAEELDTDPLKLTVFELRGVHFSFLNGHTLVGLYEYYLRLLKRARLDFETLPPEIREKVTSKELLRMNAMEFIRRVLFQATSIPEKEVYCRNVNMLIGLLQQGEEIDWRRVFISAQRALLEKVADELGKDVSEITWEDYTQRFNFLSGNSLKSFRDFYYQMLTKARQEFESLPSHIKERIRKEELDEITPAEFILRILRLDSSYQSLEELIKDLSSGRRYIPWHKVPLELQRRLLELAAQELGVDLASLSYFHFQKDLSFLSNRSLLNMYRFYSTLLQRTKKNFAILPGVFKERLTPEGVRKITPIQFIKKILNIPISPKETLGVKNADLYGTTEGVIKLAYQGKRIYWSKIALSVHRNIILLAAEELGVTPASFGSQHFSHHFQFLNGRTLEGLRQFYSDRFFKDYLELPERFREIIDQESYQRVENVSDFIRVILGLSPSESPICENLEELLSLYRHRNGEIDWGKVPIRVQRQLLEIAAQELNVELGEIDENILQKKSLSFLGGTLGGFYRYYGALLEQARRDYISLPQVFKLYLRREEVDDFEPIDLIRRVLEITPNFIIPKLRSASLSFIGTGSDLEGYTPQELEWIKGYKYILHEELWKEIAKDNPEQIAFYVKLLAKTVIEQEEVKFTGLWDLLNSNRLFEQVPMRDLDNRSLKSLLNYFRDSWSILRFLEEKGLIEKTEEEIYQWLGN